MIDIADRNEVYFSNAASKIIREDTSRFFNTLYEREKRKFLEACKEILFEFDEDFSE